MHIKIDPREQDIKSVMRKLRVLPEKVQRAVMRPALRKAGGIVAKSAKKKCPKGLGLRPNGQPRKHLKRTIKTIVKYYKRSGAVVAVVGCDKKEAPHAHLVHDGTGRRVYTVEKPSLFGGRWHAAGMLVDNPGSKAVPFLANAVDETRGAVQRKLKAEILAGIEKQVAKMRAQR